MFDPNFSGSKQNNQNHNVRLITNRMFLTFLFGLNAERKSNQCYFTPLLHEYKVQVLCNSLLHASRAFEFFNIVNVSFA